MFSNKKQKIYHPITGQKRSLKSMLSSTLDEQYISSKKITLNFYCRLHDNREEICNIYECSGIKYIDNNHMPYIK